MLAPVPLPTFASDLPFHDKSKLRLPSPKGAGSAAALGKAFPAGTAGTLPRRGREGRGQAV